MSAKSIVAVSGGLRASSKTTLLARSLLRAVVERVEGEAVLVQLGELAQDLGSTLERPSASKAVESALRVVEGADVLVAVTPVYRGSYSGHFKHFFDLVEQNTLVGVPVIVGATAGGSRHCMVLELALKPLFGFFQAFTVPTGVYATESDFEAGVLRGAMVLSRARAAAEEAARLVRRSDRARSTEGDELDTGRGGSLAS